jgi:hypothetical protein
MFPSLSISVADMPWTFAASIAAFWTVCSLEEEEEASGGAAKVAMLKFQAVLR